MFCKFSFKWLGLCQIYNSIKDKDMYKFKKLDEL